MSMYQSVDELERTLAQLASEQTLLLELLMRQRAALQTLDVASLEGLTDNIERHRLRVAAVEGRCRALLAAAAGALRLAGSEQPTLSRLTEAVLDQRRRERLRNLRGQLRERAESVERASQVNARLTGALLGHLNTSVRLLISGVGDTATYTRSGTSSVQSMPLQRRLLETVG